MTEPICGAVAVSAIGPGPVRVPFRLCCVAALCEPGRRTPPTACPLARAALGAPGTNRPAAVAEHRDDLGRAA